MNVRRERRLRLSAITCTALLLFGSACSADRDLPTAAPTTERADLAASMRDDGSPKGPEPSNGLRRNGTLGSAHETDLSVHAAPARLSEERENAAIALIARSAGAIANLRDADLAKMESTLSELARRSPRGEQAVRLRRKVLAAIRTSHELAIARPAEPADGASIEVGFEDWPQIAEDGLETDGAGMEAISGPAAEPWKGSNEAMTCTSYFAGVEYTGECATQQERDDAEAILLGMGDEVETDYREAQALCLTVYGSGEHCYYDQENNSAHEVGFESAAENESGETSAADDGDTPTFVGSATTISMRPCPATDSGAVALSCFYEGLNAALAIVAYGFSKSDALRLVREVSSKSGVAAAVFAAFSAGYVGATAVIAYLDCINEA